MKWNKKLIFLFSLGIIILLGAFFRFYNLNWDQGYFFHPDERNIANAVSRIRFFSQLNPQFFAYGSLPIYLYRFTGDFLVVLTKNQDWVLEWPKINLIGRAFSALFSTISLIFVFLLSKRLFNKKIAFLAVFFTAFCPSLIQMAHFSVTESMLVFWVLLITILSFKIADKGTIKNYSLLGIVCGLSLATKTAAISFLIIPVATHLFFYLKNIKAYLKGLLSFGLAFLTFTILSPYAFLAKEKFLESMRYESGVVLGKLKVVYVLQFEKTLPYLFQLKNLLWQMGPVALLAIFGVIILLIFALKKRCKKILVFLSFPIVYFLYIGSWYTKFIRYMVPLLPFLAIILSWLLYQIYLKRKLIGKILILISLSLSFLWALAFSSIYLKESTRITASKWIYENIKEESKILTEHWDDGLPLDLKGGKHPFLYQIEQLTIYEADNQEKVNYYAEKLSQADYLVLNSRRLYGTLMFLEEKYPLTSRYYLLLFTEKLGYNKVAEFSVYPSLFNLEIKDDESEETFQVYDHPKVIIFENQKQFSQEEIKNILNIYD
jgi:4-amino-4-deoxy-L-arabinose transferase-like glycosyltransferase